MNKCSQYFENFGYFQKQITWANEPFKNVKILQFREMAFCLLNSVIYVGDAIGQMRRTDGAYALVSYVLFTNYTSD